MFEAPEIIRNIPDIKAIYDMNEKQGENLETEVERMDNNLFLESMDEAMTARWETMLEITKADNDTIAGQEIPHQIQSIGEKAIYRKGNWRKAKASVSGWFFSVRR